MEHPFIHGLEKQTVDELQNKISELTSKLNFAYRTGNSQLIQQLTMALESYKAAFTKKMDDLIKKQNFNTQIKVEKNK
jgi:hypothetical protein